MKIVELLIQCYYATITSPSCQRKQHDCCYVSQPACGCTDTNTYRCIQLVHKRFYFLFLVVLLLVPSDAIVKLDTRASKTIQSASDSQIHLAIAEPLYIFQVFKMSTTPCISDWDRAPLGKSFH